MAIQYIHWDTATFMQLSLKPHVSLIFFSFKNRIISFVIDVESFKEEIRNKINKW